MSMQVRPGYINPLNTMKNTKQEYTFFGKNKTADKEDDLQTKQQQLQNALLLMKSTGTDSSASTAEQQEKLQAELEKVSKELQAAKNDISQTDMLSDESESVNSLYKNSRIDIYEKNTEEMESYGLYELKRERNSGYHIYFSPYSE